MKFTKYLNESLEADYEEELSFTKEDIIEMISVLDDDELQEIGEELMELIWSDEDEDDVETMEYAGDVSLEEKKYFKKRANQVNRDKKQNKSDKRKLAKKRKLLYKKNKSKIKRKQKIYRKKVKRSKGKNVRSHR